MMSQYSNKSLAFLFTICVLLSIASCTNDLAEVKSISEPNDFSLEIGENIEMLYSDSAIVRVRILSPLLKRYTTRQESYDEFPNGLHVEFFKENQKVTSWLTADYAIRKDKDSKIYVENNVVLYNKRNEKLFTDELIWDEENEIIYTNKVVKIVQPALGDTSLGFGFRADQEFTRFEFLRSYSAIKNIDDLAEKLK